MATPQGAIVSNITSPIPINQYLSNIILATPTAPLLASTFALIQNIPYNSGNQLMNVRFQNLPPAVSAIAPGSQGPSPVFLNRDLILTALSLYGQAIFIDSRSVEQNELPLLAAGSERLAYSIRQGQDLLYYATIDAGASMYGCRYGVNGDTPSEVTNEDCLSVYASMLQNNAPYVTGVLAGNLQFGTNPLTFAYALLCAPTQLSTFSGLQGFLSVGAYPIETDTRPFGEFGYLTNAFFRIFASSNVPPSNSVSTMGNRVDNIYALGSQAYTGVGLTGDNINFLYRSPIYSNPLGLQVSLGASLFFGSTITEETWILRILATGSTINVFGG